MQKESTIFKQRLVSMYKEHVNLINKLPEIVDEKLDEEEAAEAEAQAAETAEVAEEAPVVETVAEENITVIDKPVVEETPVEASVEETVEEEPVVIGKPAFGFDISKIDFEGDDDDDDIAHAVSKFDDFEASDVEDDNSGTTSFKSFFKKK